MPETAAEHAVDPLNDGGSVDGLSGAPESAESEEHEEPHVPHASPPNGSGFHEAEEVQDRLATPDGHPDGSGQDEFTEERDLRATITATTDFQDLADHLMDLHRRGRLCKPLLRTVADTIHLFRCNESREDILEAFTATLLPVPPEHFTLSLADLLGPRVAAENGLDPDEEVRFPLARLRKVIIDQIPLQEKRRSRVRAVAIVKQCLVWDYDKPAFSQAKRLKRKRQ